jgi:hypothetical protein
MRRRSVRKYSLPVCFLVTSLSAAPVFANWYANQSGTEDYYEPNNYNNGKFGEFPPADIDKKLFGHLTTDKEAVENKTKTDDAVVTTNSKRPLAVNNQQVQNPAQQYSQQNPQQPAYSRYNRGRNYPQQRNQRYNRSAGFNGPWNNNNSGFSGPWNNNGSSFSGPWNGGGNDRGSNFSGPWNNNGSNFDMPWGNNKGDKGNKGSGFNPMGNGSSWGW